MYVMIDDYTHIRRNGQIYSNYMTCMQLPLLLGSVSPGSLVLGCPITNVSKLSLSWHTCSRHVYTWRHVAGSTDLGPRPARPHLAGGGGGGARAEVGVVVGRHGPAAPAEGAAHSEPEEDEE